MRTFVRVCLSALLLSVLAVPAAYGQGAVAGVVKDSTGGVLPGVTVEARSPALIEGARTAVTDANGRYTIADLRPGVYTVTFTLAGFTVVKREGIELATSFTAPVNVELAVGEVKETVTVSGETPVVDVQGSVAQTVMDRKVLEAVPTGRNVFAVGELIAGITTSVPDVGGSKGMQQPVFQVHGSSTNDMLYQEDGIPMQHIAFGGNQTGLYFNDGTLEEVSYQTSALPAEVSTGGVRINMIPRDGGNQFHGTLFATGSNEKMQSDNMSAALLARGLTAPNRLYKVYDINLSAGGPIKRDRLWFFGSYRRWGANSLVANTFNPDRTQALDDNVLKDWALRLTLQASAKNKISFAYDWNAKVRGHRRSGATFVQPEAANLQNHTHTTKYLLKWFSTITNRLMLDAGVTQIWIPYTLTYEPSVAPTDISTLDFSTSVLNKAAPYTSLFGTRVGGYNFAVSYVTGSHNLKVGLQFREGWFSEDIQANGDMEIRLLNGVPNSVDTYNTPLTHEETMNGELGVFAQDSWTMKRLTVNAGVRFDHLKMSLPAQSAPGGTFAPARQFPAKDMVDWNNVVPRLGITYDLFGDAKTALKISASEYMRMEGTGLIQSLNPNYLSTDRRSWTDLNHDGIPELNELGPSTGFAVGVNTRLSPDMKRARNWEYTASIEHEIRPLFSVSTGFFVRQIRNLYAVRNILVPSDRYLAVTITNPLTGQPLTVYNQDPATRGLNSLVMNNESLLDVNYRGFEVKLNKRFAQGATLFGGFTVGSTRGSTLGQTSDLNNPNLLINHVGNIGYDATYQFNGAGSYLLPLGIQLSGSFRSATGLPLSRTYTVTTADVPNLTQVNQSVQLVSRGTYRLQRANLLDLRVAKVLRFGSTRLELTADVYNVLNANATTGEVQSVGPSLGRPSAIVDGRLLRMGAQFKF
jgi:Carboxypeptidase regulatory-like domain